MLSESVDGLIGGGSGGVKRIALRPGLEEGFILRKRIRMIGMDPLLWATQFYMQLKTAYKIERYARHIVCNLN